MFITNLSWHGLHFTLKRELLKLINANQWDLYAIISFNSQILGLANK